MDCKKILLVIIVAVVIWACSIEAYVKISLNIIAHQTDRMHYDAQMKPVTKETVEFFLYDVEKIVHARDGEVRKTD